MTHSIIKPDNCALAFTIPLDEESFKQKEKVPDREYTKETRWELYEKKIAGIYEKMKSNFQQLGVNIFYNVTLDCFKGLLDGEIDVVILFAHFRNNDSGLYKPGIEFFDGFATIPEIVDVVPYNFSGILDLTVCNPTTLVVKLKEKNRDYLIKSGFGNATPVVWMGFYLALFKYLHDNDSTYIKALEETVKVFHT
ncbi:hypothetical protein MBAV_006189 [Candidatus Magnetobacterium bavaricum]|uniref:Uncharacterized protein n=1 Tax=Candidatus Magnetobacterium bavaricum TaxID=29290 RepID=A0A0F3GIH2_9BACT|nr:hypothetical protein MBAV_006189 [Candidatus Magnetobacterium bavaricum]